MSTEIPGARPVILLNASVQSSAVVKRGTEQVQITKNNLMVQYFRARPNVTLLNWWSRSFFEWHSQPMECVLFVEVSAIFLGWYEAGMAPSANFRDKKNNNQSGTRNQLWCRIPMVEVETYPVTRTFLWSVLRNFLDTDRIFKGLSV